MRTSVAGTAAPVAPVPATMIHWIVLGGVTADLLAGDRCVLFAH